MVCHKISPSDQRARSIAPGAARMPSWICAPSKAGPDAHEQQRTFPFATRPISVFVPMSRAMIFLADFPHFGCQQHGEVVRTNIAGDDRGQVGVRPGAEG